MTIWMRNGNPKLLPVSLTRGLPISSAVLTLSFPVLLSTRASAERPLERNFSPKCLPLLVQHDLRKLEAVHETSQEGRI